MSELTLYSGKEYFLKEEKPFFCLADTVWAVFSRAKLKEWEAYLQLRKKQGFNALQISVLPIVTDTTQSPDNRFPFLQKADGTYDFNALNGRYFDIAEEMLKMAETLGFTPVLALIWCTYVKNTWACKRVPQYAMTKGQILRYVEYTVNRFRPYHPVYFISGDTAFEETEVDFSVFTDSLHLVQKLSPEALTSMHIMGNTGYLPEEYKGPDGIDFYSYQSGHNGNHQANAFLLARDFCAYPQKPVLNSEPCYEGHRKTEYFSVFERYGAYDVRRAAWQSVFAGAKAGVAYGAHGVWSWHRAGDTFIEENYSGSVYPWEKGLQFPGAWDMGFLKWAFCHYDLFDCVPDNTLVTCPLHAEGIGILRSSGGDKIAVYLPCPSKITLDLDLSGYTFTAYDLARRQVFAPDTQTGPDGFTIHMTEGLEDLLYIGVKNL